MLTLQDSTHTCPTLPRRPLHKASLHRERSVGTALHCSANEADPPTSSLLARGREGEGERGGERERGRERVSPDHTADVVFCSPNRYRDVWHLDLRREFSKGDTNSLLPYLAPSLPSYITSSLPPSLPCSLTTSLPRYLALSIPHYLASSLTTSLPCSLTTFLLRYLALSLPHYLPTSLPTLFSHYLTSSLPPCLTPSLPPYPTTVTTSLPHYLPP